ncbi:MAG: glycosyltransferase family 39 protein [Thermodesulfobacteriota bacterium]
MRLHDLDAPLLEGAAAKQTHTAMVARNFHRDRSVWLRPIVDDIGRPGYFLKEVPLVPAAAALLYDLRGGVDERLGRLLSIVAWLLGVPLLTTLLRRSRAPGERLLASAWFLAAPLGVVYSRAFMSDAALVTASLGALLALARWREQPTAGRALLVGACTGLALALKPHALLWLVPAGVVLLWPTRTRAAWRAPRALATLLACLAAGLAPAALWYVHAAAVHRAYPAAGAMVAEGWVAPHLLLEPRLYLEIARQTIEMVFTPLGAAIAVLGLVLERRWSSVVERALLAWGGGVLVECLVFATRMFDERARGTEYYQLALVPVAALLVARGVSALVRAVAPASVGLRAGVSVALLLALLGNSFVVARSALGAPPEYASLVERCETIRTLTSPRDDIFVLSDRGGTILYYCDRRGTVLTLGSAVDPALAGAGARASTDELARAVASARYLYVPFPELLATESSFVEHLERDWRRVPGAGDLWLFERIDERPTRRAGRSAS